MCKLLNGKSLLFVALLLSAISMSCSKEPQDTNSKQSGNNVHEWEDSTLSGDAVMGEKMMFRVGDSLQVIRKASTRLSTDFGGQTYTLSGDERITIALKRSDNSVEGPKIYKVKNALTGALEYVKDADNNVTEPFYWKSKSETVKLRAWSYGTSTDYTTDPVGNAFSLNTDQREDTGQDNYQELLYTPEFECKYTDHSGSASINLYHQMTRLTIDLTHLATGDLSVSQVTIGDGTLPTTAKFSETGIDTGNADYIGSWEEPTVAEGTPGYVIARADQNNKKYSAVLFPKTYAAGTKLVTIKTTNGDFAYKIPAGDGLPLDPGKQYAYTISVTDLVETSTLSISDIDAYTYDGTAKEPHPIVKYGDKVLTEGTHYTLSWSNNINAGTATCTVTGKDGSIFKNSQDKNFTINPCPTTLTFAASSESVDYIWNQTKYNLTKSPSDATVEFTSNNTALVGVDASTGTLKGGTAFTSSGSATITATPTGNYTGSAVTYTVTTSKGNYTTFGYTGNPQSITLPKGGYQIECWGAQGGQGAMGASSIESYPETFDTNGVSIYGRGGYTKGNLQLASNETVNVYVGGIGDLTHKGWNGGGYTETINTRNFATAGGGATDIRIGTTLSTRIMVAAGGGGSSHGGWGGCGGGLNGGTGIKVSAVYTGANAMASYGRQDGGGAAGAFSWNQGSAPTAGSLGQGGVGNSAYGGGGGGGLYGGGGAGVSSNSYGAGGGGSSYISGHSGCVTHASYAFISSTTQMINGVSSMPAPGGGTETGHPGDGYARISFVSQ